MAGVLMESLEAASKTARRPQRSVLIVDRSRLAKLIAMMLTRSYRTFVATDTIGAANKLKKQAPDLLLVDVDVPGDGIRFTELVRRSPKFRSLPVILMSGRPSPDSLSRARRAGATAYVAKPFRPKDLQTRIESALLAGQTPFSCSTRFDLGVCPETLEETASGSSERAGEVSMAETVGAIESLPPFPATYAEIMKLARDGSSSSREIARKIQLDPSLLATVFKLANSSYFGFRNRVDSLDLAVTLLGVEGIANLVLSAQTFDALGNTDGQGGLDLQSFWRHAVGTAFVARTLAARLNVAEESAFLSGMLHDLGKVVLDRFFADRYKPVLEHARTHEMSLIRAEETLLELTHAQIGGQLAVEWKLAEKFQDCMLYHHVPQTNCRYHRLVCLVHLADVLCRNLGYGSSGDVSVPEIDPSVQERFSLGSERLKAYAEDAQRSIEGADSFLAALGG